MVALFDLGRDTTIEHFVVPWIEMPNNGLNSSTLTRRIGPFEDHQQTWSGPVIAHLSAEVQSQLQ